MSKSTKKTQNIKNVKNPSTPTTPSTSKSPSSALLTSAPLKWFLEPSITSEHARVVMGANEPTRVLDGLNLTLGAMKPPKIAIPDKKKVKVELADGTTVSFPESYEIKEILTVKRDGRKAVYKTNGTKCFACLADGCINPVIKLNYCDNHRDKEYEKAFKTTVRRGNGNTILVNLNGANYKNVYFRVTANRINIVQSHVWYMNPRNEVICDEGKLVDMLVGDGWKCRQKEPGIDYTNSNLEMVHSGSYVPDGKVTCHVPLSGDKGFGKEAKVDLEMFDFVQKYSWNFNSGGYAQSKAGLMHRLIMASIHGEDAIEGMVVDHIDGDRLNNTRANLRIATHKQNAKNKTSTPESGYEGVYEVLSSDGNEIECYVCRLKDIEIFKDKNPKMCALVYDSVVTYVYGGGKRLNDNVSEAPLPIEKWNLGEEVMIKLQVLKEKHTDLHGVRHTRDGWKASITIDIGIYNDQEEAGRAYDLVAQLLKANAPLNFDPNTYTGRDFALMMKKLFEP